MREIFCVAAPSDSYDDRRFESTLVFEARHDDRSRSCTRGTARQDEEWLRERASPNVKSKSKPKIASRTALCLCVAFGARILTRAFRLATVRSQQQLLFHCRSQRTRGESQRCVSAKHSNQDGIEPRARELTASIASVFGFVSAAVPIHCRTSSDAVVLYDFILCDLIFQPSMHGDSLNARPSVFIVRYVARRIANRSLLLPTSRLLTIQRESSQLTLRV